MPSPRSVGRRACDDTQTQMTCFDAQIMLQLAEKSVRASRSALVLAFEAQLEAERSLAKAREEIRALSASVAA